MTVGPVFGLLGLYQHIDRSATDGLKGPKTGLQSLWTVQRLINQNVQETGLLTFWPDLRRPAVHIEQ